jgi:hypothetical protein
MRRLLAAVAATVFGVTLLATAAEPAEAAEGCVLINLTIQITPGSELTLLCL